MPDAPLLKASGISKSYAGVHALHAVSFDLHPGEVHALVGENGAAKSTLIKVITGATEADSGTLEIRGAVVQQNSPTRSRALGVAATVTENIALSLEQLGPWRRIHWRRRRAETETAGANRRLHRPGHA